MSYTWHAPIRLTDYSCECAARSSHGSLAQTPCASMLAVGPIWELARPTRASYNLRNNGPNALEVWEVSMQGIGLPASSDPALRKASTATSNRSTRARTPACRPALIAEGSLLVAICCCYCCCCPRQCCCVDSAVRNVLRAGPARDPGYDINKTRVPLTRAFWSIPIPIVFVSTNLRIYTKLSHKLGISALYAPPSKHSRCLTVSNRAPTRTAISMTWC